MHAKNKVPWNSLFGLISLLLGMLVGIGIIGLNGINPKNIGWFNGGDPLVHYLSWEFFRHSPWTIPIGLNPNYGLEIGSSLIYADPIPLLAFIFKPLSDLLPTPFQYLGLWTLMCISLQGYFGYVLSKKITSSYLCRLLIGIFFIFIPALLFRIGFHTALTSHFLILWAIALIINHGKFAYWIILIVISSLVNSYLLTMILGLWLANLVDKISSAQIKPAPQLTAFMQTAITGLLITFLFWQAGYFAIPSASYGIGGFGVQRINVLSPFNAQSWSYILPSIPEAYDDLIGGNTGLDFYARRTESFQYFGLGFLLLLILAAPALWKLRTLLFKKIFLHKYVCLMLVAFTIFAISNNVGLSHLSFHIPIDDLIYKIASTWRASARFFWPVTYVLLFATLWLIFKWYRPKNALIILALCLSIQVLDTRAGWISIHHKMSESNTSVIFSPLKSPFWAMAGNQYKNIKIYPLKFNITQNGWDVFGMYALNYHLNTNISYLARLNRDAIESYNHNFASQTIKGDYEPESFFILEEEMLLPVFMSLKSTDLLAQIDGFYVLAPNWFNKNNGRSIDGVDTQSLHEKFAIPKLNQGIFFGSGGNGVRYFIGGYGDHHPWGYPEKWGTWITGHSAKIIMPLPREHASKIHLRLRFPLSPKHPITKYEILLSGEISPLRFTTDTGIANQIIALPAQAIKDGFISLNFYVDNPIVPKDIGIGDDSRKIGLGLESLTFK